MKLAFQGQLIEVRGAKDKDGNVKPGQYKLKFLTMPDGSQIEVNSTVLPEDKYKFQPLDWSLEVTARMFQGLLSLSAASVHGEKSKVS